MDSRNSPGSAERSVFRNTSQMVNSQAPVHGVPSLLQIGLPIYQSFPVVQPYFLLGTVARSPILLLRSQSSYTQQSIIPRLPQAAVISDQKNASNQFHSLSVLQHSQINMGPQDIKSDTVNFLNTKINSKTVEGNTGQNNLMLDVKSEPQGIPGTRQNSISRQVVVSLSTEHNDQVNEVQQSIIPRHPVATDISKPKSATNQCLSISEFNNSPSNIEKKDNINLANEGIKPETTESNIVQDSLMLAVKSEPQEIQKITNTNQNVIPQRVVVSFSTDTVERVEDENVVKTESTDIPIREPIESDVGVMSSALQDRTIPKTELVNVTCGHTSNHDGETKLEDVEFVNQKEITDQVITEMMETAGKQTDISDVKSDSTDAISQSHNANIRDIMKKYPQKKHYTVTGSAGIHNPTAMNPRYLSKSRDIQNGELATNCTGLPLHASYFNVNTKHQPYKNLEGKVYTEAEKLGIEKNTELAKMVLPNILAKFSSQSNLSNLSLSGKYLCMGKEKQKRILINPLLPKANVNTQTRPLTETSNTTASNMPASCSARPISLPTQLTQSKLKTMTISSLKEQPSTINKPTRLKPMEYSDNLLSPIKVQPQIRNVLNSSTTPSDKSLCSMITKIQQSKTSTTVIESQSKLITRATERQEEDGHSSSSISQIELRNSPLSIVNQKLKTPLQSCSGSSNNRLSAMNDKLPVSEASKQMPGVMKTISHGADRLLLGTYLQCAHCDAVFDKSRELSRHILLVHESIAPDRYYQCGKCLGNTHSYYSITALRKHLKYHHNITEANYLKEDRLMRQKFITPLQPRSSSSKQMTDEMKTILHGADRLLLGTYLQCGHCNAVFNKDRHLSRHISLVHESIAPDRFYQCGKCKGNKHSFYSIKELSKHVKFYHRFEKPISSLKDGLTRQAQQKLTTPIQSCSSSSNNCVSTMDNKMPSSENSKQMTGVMGQVQQQKERKINEYTCSVCSAFLPTKARYKKHMMSHSSVLCHVCGQLFENKKWYSIHFKVHLPKRQYSCSVCQTVFSQKHFLEKHMKKHEIKKDVYLCPFCGKFVSRLRFASHKHSHETSYCTKCGKRFANKKSLMEHVKRHLGKTLMKCDLCGKKFGSYKCLVCHIKRHIGEKLNKCDICNIQFPLISALKIHFKTLKHLSKYHSKTRR